MRNYNICFKEFALHNILMQESKEYQNLNNFEMIDELRNFIKMFDGQGHEKCNTIIEVCLESFVDEFIDDINHIISTGQKDISIIK